MMSQFFSLPTPSRRCCCKNEIKIFQSDNDSSYHIADIITNSRRNSAIDNDDDDIRSTKKKYCCTSKNLYYRGWYYRRILAGHSSSRQHFLLLCLLVLLLLLSFMIHPTCYAFQNHFIPSPTYPQQQQQQQQHLSINRKNFHYREAINYKELTSRIFSLKDNSNDDAICFTQTSNENVKMNVETRTLLQPPPSTTTTSLWERMAYFGVSHQYNIISTPNSTNGGFNNNDDNIHQFVSNIATPPEQLYDYGQYISVFRVIIPSFGYATITKLIYPSLAMWVAVSFIHGDSGVYAVVAQDVSQFLQNICTTSGLVFSILIGQSYYFMYQQQEKIYYAIYDEVAMAKMVLEQISLISRGRTQLYRTILQQMDRYVRNDLQLLNDIDPATMLSSRPCDDPLEDILYLTSVGEPSHIYQSIRSLRQARAQRLGSLQMKLPEIQMTLLWILAAIVLVVFPLLGAGSQTIGGSAILQVQSWYISFLVFGISLVMGVIYELRSPNQPGAYNARTVLSIMISGLQEELEQRLQDSNFSSPLSVFISDDATIINGGDSSNTTTTNFAYYDAGPSVDSDGSF